VNPVRSSPVLGDETFSWWERLSILLLGLIVCIVAAAIISETLSPGNVLDSIFQDYFLDPIRAESLADGSYNQVNTLSYNFTLILSVISIAAILRKVGISATECTIFALLPWVIWAALGEVVEDASLFGSSLESWFVSPGIHFQGAIWVILSGFIASLAAKSGQNRDDRIWVTGASIALVTFQTILFLTSLQEGRIGTSMENLLNLWPVAIFGLIAIIVVIFSHPFMEKWSSIEQGIFQVGIGGCIVLYGCLHSYIRMMLKLEESGDKSAILSIDRSAIIPETGVVEIFHPEALFWTLVVPFLALFTVYLLVGRPNLQKLKNCGISVPGLLPPGISLSDYEKERTQLHDNMESLTWKAILASPIVLIAMYGQAVDGIATGIGLAEYGYIEKHVLSSAVIEFFGSAYGFTVLKCFIGMVVWWFYALQRWEYRYRHLRILMALALMTVGLAPGLRDVFRMALGV
tara:strand:+ start:12837 stop:14222 length:1386 start_codon:yes stop_codon:yes gene_type:complete